MPMDTFVGIGTAAQDALDDKTYARLVEQESYGSAFGNILTLGALHVAPDTPEVAAFLEYSRAHNAALNNLTVRVHKDEATAVQSVMRSTRSERTWALLAFKELSQSAMVKACESVQHTRE